MKDLAEHQQRHRVVWRAARTEGEVGRDWVSRLSLLVLGLVDRADVLAILTDMRFANTSVAGAKMIDPEPHEDARGRFFRVWCSREFEEHGIAFVPVQANMGFSARKGTLRGLHLQLAPALEAKLIRCTRGSIFDVIIDLRPESVSYKTWYGVELSAENGRMLYIPESCAHGYQTLEGDTEIHYMASGFYDACAARGVRYDDPVFNIQWPMPATSISEQDRNWPLQEGPQRFVTLSEGQP